MSLIATWVIWTVDTSSSFMTKTFDLTNINAHDLSTYLVYDPLQGHFADYLRIGPPISVRSGEFLIYWHADTSDEDCFSLKPFARKLHQTIASAWPNNPLVPHGYLISLGLPFIQNESTLHLKGRCKAEDSDREAAPYVPQRAVTHQERFCTFCSLSAA